MRIQVPQTAALLVAAGTLSSASPIARPTSSKIPVRWRGYGPVIPAEGVLAPVFNVKTEVVTIQTIEPTREIVTIQTINPTQETLTIQTLNPTATQGFSSVAQIFKREILDYESLTPQLSNEAKTLLNRGFKTRTVTKTTTITALPSSTPTAVLEDHYPIPHDAPGKKDAGFWQKVAHFFDRIFAEAPLDFVSENISNSTSTVTLHQRSLFDKKPKTQLSKPKTMYLPDFFIYLMKKVFKPKLSIPFDAWAKDLATGKLPLEDYNSLIATAQLIADSEPVQYWKNGYETPEYTAWSSQTKTYKKRPWEYLLLIAPDQHAPITTSNGTSNNITYLKSMVLNADYKAWDVKNAKNKRPTRFLFSGSLNADYHWWQLKNSEHVNILSPFLSDGSVNHRHVKYLIHQYSSGGLKIPEKHPFEYFMSGTLNPHYIAFDILQAKAENRPAKWLQDGKPNRDFWDWENKVNPWKEAEPPEPPVDIVRLVNNLVKKKKVEEQMFMLHEISRKERKDAGWNVRFLTRAASKVVHNGLLSKMNATEIVERTKTIGKDPYMDPEFGKLGRPRGKVPEKLEEVKKVSTDYVYGRFRHNIQRSLPLSNTRTPIPSITPMPTQEPSNILYTSPHSHVTFNVSTTELQLLKALNLDANAISKKKNWNAFFRTLVNYAGDAISDEDWNRIADIAMKKGALLDAEKAAIDEKMMAEEEEDYFEDDADVDAVTVKRVTKDLPFLELKAVFPSSSDSARRFRGPTVERFTHNDFVGGN